MARGRRPLRGGLLLQRGGAGVHREGLRDIPGRDLHSFRAQHGGEQLPGLRAPGEGVRVLKLDREGGREAGGVPRTGVHLHRDHTARAHARAG